MRVRRDPIALELVENTLASMADDVAVTIVRTARSFVMKRHGLFAAIRNADGQMVAQGLCLPGAG